MAILQAPPLSVVYFVLCAIIYAHGVSFIRNQRSIFDSDSNPLRVCAVNRAFFAVTNVQLLVRGPVLLHGGNGECQRLVIGKSLDVDGNRRFQRGGRVSAVDDFPGGRFYANVHT